MCEYIWLDLFLLLEILNQNIQIKKTSKLTIEPINTEKEGRKVTRPVY